MTEFSHSEQGDYLLSNWIFAHWTRTLHCSAVTLEYPHSFKDFFFESAWCLRVHSPKLIPIEIGIPSWIPNLGWNSKLNTDSNWNSKLNSWSVGRVCFTTKTPFIMSSKLWLGHNEPFKLSGMSTLTWQIVIWHGINYLHGMLVGFPFISFNLHPVVRGTHKPCSYRALRRHWIERMHSTCKWRLTQNSLRGPHRPRQTGLRSNFCTTVWGLMNLEVFCQHQWRCEDLPS